MLAIVVVCCVLLAVPGQRVWSSLVLSIGFGHYALALWYSRRTLGTVAGNARWWIPFLVLVAAASALYFGRLPLFIYFSVHHVFNEVYAADRTTDGDEVTNKRGLFGSAVFLNVAVYFTVLRNEPEMPAVDHRFLFAGLAIGVVAYAAAAYRNRRGMSFPQLVDRCLFEVLGLLVVALSLFVEITFLQVVMYHFVFWMLYPIPRLQAQGGLSVARYAMSTVAVTAVFLALSPMGWNRQAVWTSSFYEMFVPLSYAHITTSFALSQTQPRWIRRMFNPSPS